MNIKKKQLYKGNLEFYKTFTKQTSAKFELAYSLAQKKS